MKRFAAALLCMGMSIAAPIASANEDAFLQSLDGKWSGSGTVRVRTDSSPVKVTCKFSSDAKVSSLSLDGNCRGLVVVTRAIQAQLTAHGASYSGSYVGAGTGTAGLRGSRSGNSIDLGIRWAEEVNGDRSARLMVEKIGTDRMKLTTLDQDPKSGKSVITSQIDLRRV